MYNFTSFAVTLNELEPGMERLLAPTDCRLRPDIRAMENGEIGTIRPLPDTGGKVGLTRIFQNVFIFLCFLSVLFYSDLASTEKERLEEKQRAARRERSKDEEEWSTRSVSLRLLSNYLFMTFSFALRGFRTF